MPAPRYKQLLDRLASEIRRGGSRVAGRRAPLRFSLSRPCRSFV